MTSKTWVPGTVIDSPWLQDINNTTYLSTTPAAGTFRAGLLDGTNPTVGDALVGVKRTSIAAVTSQLHNWIEGTVVSAAEVGFSTSNSGAANATAINLLAALSPAKRIYIPAGTYNVADIDFTTSNPYIFGDGPESTKLVYTGTAIFINAVKSLDLFLPRSPIYIEGIGFSGVTKGSKTGIAIENRHDWVLRNSTIDHFSTVLTLKNAYIGLVDSVSSTDCDIGWDLLGDINRVAFRSSGVTDFTTYGTRIKSSVNGSIALTYDNCDFEFAGGVAVRCESADIITFNDCYIGDGLLKSNFEIVSGRIVATGGLVFAGQDASFANKLVEFVGANPIVDERSLTLKNVKIAAKAFLGPEDDKFIKVFGSSDKVYIFDSLFGTLPFWVGGAIAITGDPLGKAPGMSAVASPFGRAFTVGMTGAVTATATPSLLNGSSTFACTVGGAGTMYFSSPLTAGKLQTFGAGNLIITYSSNADFTPQLTSGPGSVGPLVSFGANILANTGGAVKTLIIQNQNPLAAAYTHLEGTRTNPTAGNTITIYDAYVADERQSGGLGTVSAGKNLYKPI